MKRTIYIGLPCYNEEKDINDLIDKILDIKNKILKEFKYQTKIFCVNDGSLDMTEEIIKLRKIDNIKLINHEKNKGLGETMKTILTYFNKIASKNDRLIVMDADNSHNPKYIIDLIKMQEQNNNDVVIASRYQNGSEINGLKKYRIIISDIAKLWYTKILKIPNVKDYTCGYRLYTYKIVDSTIKKYGNKIITQSSFACMMELLYKLHLNGAKIGEIPFLLEYDKKNGESKMKVFKTTIDSLSTTIKIKRKNFKNLTIYIIILLLSIILMFMSCSRLKNVGLFWDAAVYLNVSRNIVQGKIIYKDIVDNKGPVLYFINAIALKLGGQVGVCIVEFLFIFISILFMYKSMKLINNNKLQIIIMLFMSSTFFAEFFTYGLSCEEYALAFSMIGLYECIKYYKNNCFSPKQLFLMGVLCALTFFIRPNLVVIFVGFGIGIGLKLIIEKKFKELIIYILYSLAGFITVCIPIFIYLLKNNCIKEFIQNAFFINMSINKCGFLNSLIHIINIIPITTLTIIIYLLTSLYRLIKNKEKIYLSIICCIIITIFFNSISLTVYSHYLISFIPIILLAYNNLLTLSKNKYIIIIFLCLMLEISIHNSIQSISHFNISQPNSDIIQYIKNNTDKNDKIAVIGFYDEIYYLSNRNSVSNYTYILSNGAFSNNVQRKIVKKYIKDIIDKKPRIIVEDYATFDIGVKPYTNVEEYNQIKEKYYTKINKSNIIKIYELNENIEKNE